MISVCMAVYNGGRYLERQLNSIAAQTRKPDELLIGDDGSTDESIEIIRRFSETRARKAGIRVRLIQNPENMGYIRNFLQLLSLADGDVIFLSDQDDVWRKDKTAAMAAVLDRHPEILALSSSYFFSDETGRPIPGGPPKRSALKHISWEQYLRHPKNIGAAMAVRKSLVKQVTEQENTFAAHDWQLNEAAARQGGLWILEKPLILYRQHGDNVTGTLRTGVKSGALKARIRLLEYMRDELTTLRDLTGEEERFTAALGDTLRQRALLLRKRRILSLVALDLSHRNCVSRESVLGDLAALLFS